MMTRRRFLSSVLGSFTALVLTTPAVASDNFFDFITKDSKHSLHRRRHGAVSAQAHLKSKPREPAYAGATVVDYLSLEKPGTIIIKTHERALYQILGNGKAKRYGVAVGKEGFQWAGVARIGMKRENPVWTPPAEMIARTPEYQKWAAGMPGGLPINPLGPRAMYLYNKGDTGFRIHGTIHPESIGHAASSGCIRMLNREVIELYGVTKIGTKVIVI